MGNSLGKLFTITSFGESHGRCVGVTIDGCPAGLPFTEAEIQKELDKRKAGTSAATTTRVEEDKVEIFSGVFNGVTTGAPSAYWYGIKILTPVSMKKIDFCSGRAMLIILLL